MFVVIDLNIYNKNIKSCGTYWHLYCLHYDYVFCILCVTWGDMFWPWKYRKNQIRVTKKVCNELEDERRIAKYLLRLTEINEAGACRVMDRQKNLSWFLYLAHKLLIEETAGSFYSVQFCLLCVDMIILIDIFTCCIYRWPFIRLLLLICW